MNTIVRTVSVRTTLTVAMVGVAIIATATTGILGAVFISENVTADAQKRVTSGLDTAISFLEERCGALAVTFNDRATVAERLMAEGIEPADLSRRLAEWRRDFGFTVLNVCDPSGNPIAGSYGGGAVAVPVTDDPIIRKSLEGAPARGIVVLDPVRLYTEGGSALVGSAGGGDGMFFWVSAPLRDAEGRIDRVVYGGVLINFDDTLVDSIRGRLFGTELYRGKPLGTVTIFLDGVRIATNVLGAGGGRAIGTRVSDEVYSAVIGDGRDYTGRALVVDSWYLSGYTPILDPMGVKIGMLYVGILEEPYTALRNRLLARYGVPVIAIAAAAFMAAFFLVNRITVPLERLSEEAPRLADPGSDGKLIIPGTYREIERLAAALRLMKETLRARDTELGARYTELEEMNSKLETANGNYMEMLGFVTHELKAPLAAMQGMIELVQKGYAGPVPDGILEYLERIRRNGSDLQDMVKNYLDLSRAERGELTPNIRSIDFVKDVVVPSLEQNRPLFDARGITVETDIPDSAPISGDPELLRIAVSNYLSNAAKYGRDGGRAKISVFASAAGIRFSVWNEGEGFPEEMADKLFGKFTRLDTGVTKRAKGSGLGLYLIRIIVEKHGGTCRADSRSGEWAEFEFGVPASAL